MAVYTTSNTGTQWSTLPGMLEHVSLYDNPSINVIASVLLLYTLRFLYYYLSIFMIFLCLPFLENELRKIFS